LSGFLKSAPSLPLVVPGDDVLQGIIAGGGAASRLFVPVLFLTNKFEKMDTDAVIQMSFQTSMRGYDDFDTATDVIDNDPDFTPNHTAVVFEIPAIENVTYFVRRQENGEMIKTVMSGPAVSYANFQVQRMQYKLAKPPRTNQNVTIITLNGVIPTKVEDRQPYFYFPSWDVVFNPPSRMARFSLLGFDDRTIISVVPFWEKHRVLVLMSEIGDLDRRGNSGLAVCVWRDHLHDDRVWRSGNGGVQRAYAKRSPWACHAPCYIYCLQPDQPRPLELEGGPKPTP
jgi:hypothetical protein